MPAGITLVISRDQTTHPARRALEEAIAAGASRAGLEVLVVGHLYDLQPDSPGLQAARALEGDLVVLAWLYPRAAHWILDRHGIAGRFGLTQLAEEQQAEEPDNDGSERVASQRPVPPRTVYCLDLRWHAEAGPYLDEVQRLVAERAGPLDSGAAFSGGQETAAGPRTQGEPLGTAGVRCIHETAGRRWYPVIDYSRCTNCMECIDFCLFGVYGLDSRDTLIVEQPDNCRKGCPACSRVCPESAILFPQHKSPAIAGGVPDRDGRKIDLSHLFGAPEAAAGTIDLAARERDEHLLASGRPAAGPRVGRPDERPDSPPPDDLDRLLDQLDALDL